MIYRVISIDIAEGKNEEATAFIKKTTDYINAKYPKTKAHVVRNRKGSPRVHVIESYATWETWESTIAELKVDAAWQAMEADSRHLYVAESFAENFYDVIS